MINLLDNLKVSNYLNNQTIDGSELEFISTLKFSQMYNTDDFNMISNKVNSYKSLEKENAVNPSAEVSKAMKELSEDILYLTGQDASKIDLSSLYTTQRLDKAMLNTNLRSKNDLWVDIDYDDYSETSNYIKVHAVGHNSSYSYGIAANARMLVTSDGTIITTKNALYRK